MDERDPLFLAFSNVALIGPPHLPSPVHGFYCHADHSYYSSRNRPLPGNTQWPAIRAPVAGGAGGRVRRHRNEPAVFRPRVLSRPACHRLRAAQHLGGSVADFLGRRSLSFRSNTRYSSCGPTIGEKAGSWRWPRSSPRVASGGNTTGIVPASSACLPGAPAVRRRNADYAGDLGVSAWRTDRGSA